MNHRVSLTEGTLQTSTDLRTELIKTLDVLFTRTRGIPGDGDVDEGGVNENRGPYEEEKSTETPIRFPRGTGSRPPSYRSNSEESVRFPADAVLGRTRKSLAGDFGSVSRPGGRFDEKFAVDQLYPRQQRRFSDSVSDLRDSRAEIHQWADVWAGNSRNVIKPDDPNAYKYPQGVRYILMMIATCLTISVIALDSTIVSTATPTLVGLWQSLPDIGWYGSAYLLPLPTLQPLFGKIYPHGNTKWLFLAGLALFEGGSLICALAISSIMFIMGRMVAGIGAALLAPGVMLIIADTVPKEKRPLLTGVSALAAGAAACLGPTLGGIFTTKLSWRWCFYVNIPMGVSVGLVMAFLYKPQKRVKKNETWKEIILSLDLPGCIILSAAIVALLLGITFAAETSWANKEVIILMAIFGGLIIVLIVQQALTKDEYTMLPRSVLKKKGIIICSIFGFLAEIGSTSHVYYLPIYFQAVKEATAEQSGVDVLPYLIAQTLAGIVTGVIVHLTSYFNPTMLAGSAMFAGGAGAFLTLGVNTSFGAELGYQILAAIGAGSSQFMAMGIAQQLLDRDEESIGLSMVYMIKMLGSAVAVSICSSVFNSEFKVDLDRFGLPAPIVDEVMKNFMGSPGGISDSLKPQVASAVSQALNKVFIVPLVAGCVAFFASLFHDWQKVAKSANASQAS